MPEISVEQLECFIDGFTSNCAAQYSLDVTFFQQIVDSFKAAFQRPDKEAASFTKAQFQKIIETLGKKLATALPKESLVKASQSVEHQ